MQEEQQGGETGIERYAQPVSSSFSSRDQDEDVGDLWLRRETEVLTERIGLDGQSPPLSQHAKHLWDDPLA